MTSVVGCALLASWVGEEKGAPVRDATDDATGGEDDVTGCACDSGGGLDGL